MGVVEFGRQSSQSKRRALGNFVEAFGSSKEGATHNYIARKMTNFTIRMHHGLLV
ncbi:hypothetical protein JHK86_015966 [Glycine max]|nr:hypothetical protein JHK86_015966 [Glycine max]